MAENYSPSSDFLVWVINEDAPLVGSKFAEANLRRVIELAGDQDKSNRDWATYLLANIDLDTPAIRLALITAAEDSDEVIRAEAILGLARRDATFATPYILRELTAREVDLEIFEAAAIVANRVLVESLRPFASKGNNQIIADALAACENGKPNLRHL